MYLNIITVLWKKFSAHQNAPETYTLKPKAVFSFLPCLLSLTMFFIAVNFSYQILHTNDEEWEDSQVSQQFWLRL